MKGSFRDTLRENGVALLRGPVETLQVNVGKLCNQTCRHCHVNAGPRRKEMMSAETLDRVLRLLARSPDVSTVDITGGAPELNPGFRRLVRRARELGKEVIDRCNLTVLLEPGQEGTARFLREHRVTVVASLPCYLEENVDQQRGAGVFEKSIRALRILNDLGYGTAPDAPELNLVYNPIGPELPPSQPVLEDDYRRELRARFGVEFSRLYTITNMPIERFRKDLKRLGLLGEYMQTLVAHFNPAAAEGVMCRTLISVSWDGRLHDCDFNQMLGLPLAPGLPGTIGAVESLKELEAGAIVVADHCYGCTAGAGSSCGGTLA